MNDDEHDRYMRSLTPQQLKDRAKMIDDRLEKLRLQDAVKSQAERIKALEAGLDPFADAYLRKRIEYAKRYGADVEIGFKNFDKMPDKWKMEGITFSMGTFRHAASLLEAKP